MKRQQGAWVGWDGGPDGPDEPFDAGRHARWSRCRSARDEVEEFYEGFSNATLWPLYHDVVAKPEFHREWWDSLRRGQPAVRRAGRGARRRGRDGLGARLPAPARPAMLRELRPDLRIGFFLHIPFPPTELFVQLPWRRQILEGLLGADLVGFQRPGGAQNFVRLVRQRVGHKTHRDLVYLPDGRTVEAAAFPISIDFDGLAELSRSDAVAERAKEIREAARQPAPAAARGGPARLHQGHLRPAARVRRAARATGSSSVEDAVFVQVATPSRERVERVPPAPRRDRPARRPDQRRLRPDRPARRSPTCTRRTPARRWRRCSAPPTSWS